MSEANEQRYPLRVENVGDDTYILMSRGHHDADAFMRAVREAGYDRPLGMPRHYWIKATPCRCGEHTCHYTILGVPVRWAFPATYAHEAYGEDRYEAHATDTRQPTKGDRHANE